AETIKSIQREFPNRGVPGYYFPIELSQSEIFESFDKEIVTIIEVPFDTEDEVNKLFYEIEKIHFDFIGLKYQNPIKVKFDAGVSDFSKNIQPNDNLLFSAKIKTEKLTLLAEKAGLEIKDPKVAIKFKEEP